MIHRLELSLAIAVLFLGGCTTQPPPPVEKVELRASDALGLEEAMETHRGQVVLLDFWATWCGPCLKLLPHTIELHRQFNNRGLAVITVSLDNVDQRVAVEKFLADHGATTENHLSTYGVGPAAFTAFGIDDGALPHVRLYDRQGKLHRTFSSGTATLDATEIQRAVIELIGEGCYSRASRDPEN